MECVDSAEAGIGGRFSRLHLTIDLEGRGADARVLGMYFGDTHQTLDYRAFVNHRAPNTTSNMFLKGAYAIAAGDHMYVEAGYYDEQFVIDKAMIVHATNGTVYLGTSSP